MEEKVSGSEIAFPVPPDQLVYVPPQKIDPEGRPLIVHLGPAFPLERAISELPGVDTAAVVNGCASFEVVKDGPKVSYSLALRGNKISPVVAKAASVEAYELIDQLEPNKNVLRQVAETGQHFDGSPAMIISGVPYKVKPCEDSKVGGLELTDAINTYYLIKFQNKGYNKSEYSFDVALASAKAKILENAGCASLGDITVHPKRSSGRIRLRFETPKGRVSLNKPLASAHDEEGTFGAALKADGFTVRNKNKAI